MGKPNNGKRQVRNPNPFSTPASIERYALKMFRDIAFGSVDMSEVQVLFRDPGFVSNALKAAYEKLQSVSVHVEAIGIARPYITNPKLMEVYNDDARKLECYTLIYQTISQIQMTGDVGFLLALANKLPNYKYNM